MKIPPFLAPLLLLVFAMQPASAVEPAIFGVGFTNVTDSSARLVFTTTEPMSSLVTVSCDGKTIATEGQPTREEIHAVELKGLQKGKEYTAVISAQGKDGKTVVSPDHKFTAALHAPSQHTWPGYTIFGTTINGADGFNPELIARTGIRMVRMEVSWYDLQTNGPTINQKYLDEVIRQVEELKARGIEPLVVLDYCTPWAKPMTATTMTWRHPAFGPPDRLEDWETYLRTIVKALRGYTRYYEIWNEPDAGYLATGNYVERPNLPPPIGRPPFKDNWSYWLGDRFVPMIASVRKVMNELQPDAIVMNGGWNRDYTGQRGDLMFARGVAPDLDVYAFHTYAANPLSYARWHDAIDGGFRTNIDRIFKKHGVKMPLAVTEWGYPAWTKANPEKGFVTYDDARRFFVKSAFYFLGMERFEVLIQFSFGIGPNTRESDPLFFMLVNKEADGKIVLQPTYGTFQWLATTFGSKVYRALPVRVSPADHVTAYAIQLKDSGDTYLVVWQDGKLEDKGTMAAQPARLAEITIDELKGGKYAVQPLDLDGKPKGQGSEVSGASSFKLSITLPEISSTAESDFYLAKISAGK